MSEPVIPSSQPSVDYFIEKFRSKGELNFYEMAEGLAEVNRIFREVNELH